MEGSISGRGRASDWFEFPRHAHGRGFWLSWSAVELELVVVGRLRRSRVEDSGSSQVFLIKEKKKEKTFLAPLDARYAIWSGLFFHLPEFEFFLIYFKTALSIMGSQASKGGVAVEGKAAAADPAAVKTNGQVIHLPICDTPTSDQQVLRRELQNHRQPFKYHSECDEKDGDFNGKTTK